MTRFNDLVGRTESSFGSSQDTLTLKRKTQEFVWYFSKPQRAERVVLIFSKKKKNQP